MPSRDRKASAVHSQPAVSQAGPDESLEPLASVLSPDPETGILRLADQPCILIRPELIVSIQKQLEQTIGGSAKGILYLAGERSAASGLEFYRALAKGISQPLTLEGAKRISDASALLGWGRTEILRFKPEAGLLSVARDNSPLALAYGPSTKPVCHFLAGWMAGIGQLLLGKELVCEEIACVAQGRPRCEFELRPMPR